jgi:uncharacterized protein (TIGR02147 family)
MLKITHYKNAHEYLRDSWLEKRKKNSRFSLRAWSKQIGMSSHAPLNLMINGKRGISKKHIPALIRSLDLSPRDGLYLESLIDFNQSRSVAEKELYHSRLRELMPREDIQLFEMDSFRFIGNPLHCQILDMSDLKDFKSDPAWIKSRLFQKVSVQEIQEVIDRLLNLGLFRKNSAGNLQKTHRHLSNRPDVADLGSQEYHRSISKLASEMVGIQEVSVRQFDGYSMSIKRESIPRAKQLIYEFAKRFMQEIEVTQKDGEETYQLNLQFFPLTLTQNPHQKEGNQNGPRKKK